MAHESIGRRIGQGLRRTALGLAVTTLAFAGAPVLAQQKAENQPPAASGYAAGDPSSAMQKSMDPAVWTRLMGMMMNPQGASPIAACAECHTDEQVAQYQKDFGPALNAMWDPFKQTMNPATWNAFMQPATAMMNPMAWMNPMAMMNPMAWMNPMTMMNPMAMMNPMTMMNPMMMMNPMTMMPGMGGMMPGMPGMGGMMPGMPGMGGMMPGMPGMGGMMPGMPGMGGMMPGMPNMGGMMPGMPGMPGAAPHGQGAMPAPMDPKQYEQWFKAWTDMMQQTMPQQPAQPKQ